MAVMQPNQYRQLIPGIQDQMSLMNPFQQQQTQLATVGVFWVQGLEGAKAYQVNTSNAEVYLRDSDDSDILYIKTTDQYGRPNTLRMFRLTEEEIQDSPFPDASKYVTVDQINDILDDKFDQLLK